MALTTDQRVTRYSLGTLAAIALAFLILFLTTPSAQQVSKVTKKLDSLTVKVDDLGAFAYGELIDTLVVIRNTAIETNGVVKANKATLGRIDKRVAEMHGGFQRREEYAEGATEEYEAKDRNGNKYKANRFTERAMEARAYLNRK